MVTARDRVTGVERMRTEGVVKVGEIALHTVCEGSVSTEIRVKHFPDVGLA